MRFRSPKPARPRLSVTAGALRAATPARVVVETDAPGELRVALRLLGWDMRRSRKWTLAEREVGAGRHEVDVDVPDGLPPGCARLTEYAVLAELGGSTAAAPVRLVSATVWWPDGEPAEAQSVTIGGTLRARADQPGEVGAELHVAGTSQPRFLPVAAVEGDFAVTLPRDIPPTLHDGEDLGVSWAVRAGDAAWRFAVTDPDGVAGERRPALLTFLAQFARDPFAPQRR